MPVTGGKREILGKGLLVLTELDGQNRLRFAMYESRADFDAEEVWSEQKSGFCCCKKVFHKVFANYHCNHSQSLIFTTLPISNNIFDVYGSMKDTAQLGADFGGNSSKPSKS